MVYRDYTRVDLPEKLYDAPVDLLCLDDGKVFRTLRIVLLTSLHAFVLPDFALRYARVLDLHVLENYIKVLHSRGNGRPTAIVQTLFCKQSKVRRYTYSSSGAK